MTLKGFFVFHLEALFGLFFENMYLVVLISPGIFDTTFQKNYRGEKNTKII